ncbi:hypothetical protein K443DRAFT_674513 [Laccaria amethystina LaAM-08-1]|uniref:Uncharacterized protein n=1 Tax=Laccaria amethystina LaAM-08-1 TaxID=1095629 RepID=A0A0C9YDE5_9AGAR|nr:hypothetical protein K443DRAFT_674513 [Laccaria amethystina LaAM-08-1]
MSSPNSAETPQTSLAQGKTHHLSGGVGTTNPMFFQFSKSSHNSMAERRSSMASHWPDDKPYQCGTSDCNAQTWRQALRRTRHYIMYTMMACTSPSATHTRRRSAGALVTAYRLRLC